MRASVNTFCVLSTPDILPPASGWPPEASALPMNAGLRCCLQPGHGQVIGGVSEHPSMPEASICSNALQYAVIIDSTHSTHTVCPSKHVYPSREAALPVQH